MPSDGPIILTGAASGIGRGAAIPYRSPYRYNSRSGGGLRAFKFSAGKPPVPQPR